MAAPPAYGALMGLAVGDAAIGVGHRSRAYIFDSACGILASALGQAKVPLSSLF